MGRHLRRESLIAFLVTAVIVYSVHQIMGVEKFPWDAGDYWWLSHINNLLGFPKQIRGIVFPVILAPMRFVEDYFPQVGHIPFRVGTSLFYSIGLAVLLPDIYRMLFGGRITLVRRLVPAILTCIIYPGVIVYPLTDFPALLFHALAAWCMIKASEWKRVPYALLAAAGAASYAAYNIRPIYLMTFVFIILYTLLIGYTGVSVKRRLSYVLVIFCGAAAISSPQFFANARNGILSPMVQTAQFKETSELSLFGYQLLWGLTLQRYETSLDPSSPSPTLYYMDRAGEKFFVDNHVDGLQFSVSKYIGLALSHPIDILGIMGRHFINGLDVRDGGVYTTNISPNRDLISFLNYNVVFLGFLLTLWAAATRNKEKGSRIQVYYWMVFFLLPVLMILPGAIETRFFLPLHLGLYSVIAFESNRRFIAFIGRQEMLLIFAYSVVSSVYFAVSLSSMSSLQYFYDDKYKGPL